MPMDDKIYDANIELKALPNNKVVITFYGDGVCDYRFYFFIAERICETNSDNLNFSLNVPVVDGGAASARTDIARAQVRSLEAAREALRQNILLEVRKIGRAHV